MKNQNVPLQHQLRIARKTMTYSNVGAFIMGGMTKQDAMKILSQHGSPAEKAKYKNITKEMLEIPDSLDKWFLNHGWNNDYWKEIPLNWGFLSDDILNQYPITNEIVEWRKSQ